MTQIGHISAFYMPIVILLSELDSDIFGCQSLIRIRNRFFTKNIPLYPREIQDPDMDP